MANCIDPTGAPGPAGAAGPEGPSGVEGPAGPAGPRGIEVKHASLYFADSSKVVPCKAVSPLDVTG